MCLYSVFVFFKQKTAYEMRISDWSSDVCSSDLECPGKTRAEVWRARMRAGAVRDVVVRRIGGRRSHRDLHPVRASPGWIAMFMVQCNNRIVRAAPDHAA